MSDVYEKDKERLIGLIDALDVKVETAPLNLAEVADKREADAKIAKLMHEEEAKWLQWATVKHVTQGDNNTKYYHLIANGKYRKKNFF